MFGMKWPLLSRTATSTWTVVTSLRKVGEPSGTSFPLVLNLEGILGSSGVSELELEDGGLEGEELAGVELEDAGLDESGAGASVDVSFFLGFATVSVGSDVGLWAETIRAGIPSS